MIPGFAYGLINDTEPAINQVQAGLMKKHMRRKLSIIPNGCAAKNKQRHGRIPKDCAEKMHNPAVDKAPFMNQEQGRSDKTAQAAGARKRAVNFRIEATARKSRP